MARIGHRAICMAADDAIWIAAEFLLETMTIPGFTLADLFAFGILALGRRVRSYAGC